MGLLEWLTALLRQAGSRVGARCLKVRTEKERAPSSKGASPAQTPSEQGVEGLHRGGGTFRIIPDAGRHGEKIRTRFDQRLAVLDRDPADGDTGHDHHL